MAPKSRRIQYPARRKGDSFNIFSIQGADDPFCINKDSVISIQLIKGKYYFSVHILANISQYIGIFF